jgi:sugar lactone lactonase YvrE
MGDIAIEKSGESVPEIVDWQPLGFEVGRLPESARWLVAENCFQWVDICTGLLIRWNPETHVSSRHQLEGLIGAAIPADDGSVLLVRQRTIDRIDWASGSIEQILDSHIGDDMRLNDAAADPQGNLWTGALAMGGDYERGFLFRVTGAHSLEIERTGVLASNGIAWEPGGAFAYYADSKRHLVHQLDFDDAGHLARTTDFVHTGVGEPDGLTVDAEGCVWVAIWDGACIRRYAPSGELLATWQLPCLRPTSIAFGGADLSTMFITTATIGLSASQVAMYPQSGRVYCVPCPVPGVVGVPPLLVRI